jgi:small conductance mechanosensitive channel
MKENIMQEYLDKFIDAFILGIPNLVTALAIFIVSLYLARVVSNLLRRVLNKRKSPAGVTHLLAQLTLWSIIVAGTITALQRFFNVTAFLAGLGILGFTIGFALQDVMKNFASGIILLLQQPFHAGEVIGVKGFDGTVLAIDLRSTEMRATDGRLIILPNAEILANPIINYSRANQRRVDLSINLPYTSQPDAVRGIFLNAIQNVNGFISDPKPAVVFNNLTNSAMELTASFWVDVTKSDPAQAKDAVLMQIKSALQKEGIEIPHPVQAVYSVAPSADR